MYIYVRHIHRYTHTVVYIYIYIYICTYIHRTTPRRLLIHEHAGAGSRVPGGSLPVPAIPKHGSSPQFRPRAGG